MQKEKLYPRMGWSTRKKDLGSQNSKKYFYQDKWQTTFELAKQVGLNVKQFHQELYKYNHDAIRMMDIKLGVVNFD